MGAWRVNGVSMAWQAVYQWRMHGVLVACHRLGNDGGGIYF